MTTHLRANAPTSTITPMPRSHVPAENRLHLGWTNALARRRRPLLISLVVLILLGFNGIWRVGLDSSLFRGVARSLANGEGFRFGGEINTHVYPGFPLLLAGLQRVFGDSPIPPLVLVMILACLTLVMVDHLIRLRYPDWIANVVLLGVGLNYLFVRQSQELMTDIPFLAGSVASLLGWEWMRQASSRRQRSRGAMLLCVGLLLAASLRPTFWVIALSWALIWIGGLFAPNRNGRKRNYLIGLGVLGATALILFVLDRITHSNSVYRGVYGHEFVAHLKTLIDRTAWESDAILGKDLNVSFFSQTMHPLTAILLLIGAAIVVRREPMWGLPVFVLIPVTLIASSESRYFLMVLPMLWLGWVLLSAKLVVRLPRLAQACAFIVLMLLPISLNVGRIMGFFVEQHGCTVAAFRGENRAEAFYRGYREGSIPMLRGIARLIDEHTAPDEIVMAPETNIIGYFAHRTVTGERTLRLADAPIESHPRVLAAAPARIYVMPYELWEGDKLISRLLKKKIVVNTETIARDPNAFLARVRIVVPEGDWRQYEAPDKTLKARKHGKKVLTPSQVRKKLAKQKRALEERRLAREAKERKEARERKEVRERKELLARQAKARERAERHEAAERKAAAQRKAEAQRKAKIERREAKERKEAKARKELAEKKARKKKKKKSNPPTTSPTTQPITHQWIDLENDSFWRQIEVDDPLWNIRWLTWG